MAKINNPRKEFNFQINISGLNPFLCQEVSLPDVEFDIVSHGDTNYEVKTAGQKKIGQLSITKICPVDFPDTSIRDWAGDIQDQISGGGALPDEYKRTVLVQEFANDGVTVVEQHEFDGVWPQKLNGKKFNRKGSENTTQSIEFCVDIVS